MENQNMEISFFKDCILKECRKWSSIDLERENIYVDQLQIAYTEYLKNQEQWLINEMQKDFLNEDGLTNEEYIFPTHFIFHLFLEHSGFSKQHICKQAIRQAKIKTMQTKFPRAKLVEREEEKDYVLMSDDIVLVEIKLVPDTKGLVCTGISLNDASMYAFYLLQLSLEKIDINFYSHMISDEFIQFFCLKPIVYQFQC